MSNFTDEPGVNTSCEHCIFATYQDNRQVSCQLNLLDRFRTKNATVETYKCKENNKQFFIIYGRVCVYNRSLEWKNKQKPNTNFTKEVRK